MIIARKYNKVVYIWNVIGMLKLVDLPIDCKQVTEKTPVKVNIHDWDRVKKYCESKDIEILEIQ